MLKNKKTISILIVMLLIVIVGIIMLFVKGMNYSLIYGENTTVELYLETDFDFSDVQNIIIEVFGNDVKTRQVNNLNRDILIITQSAQEDQLNSLISKINEKYSLNLEINDLLVTNNEEISIMDLISPYILPIVISSIVILIYFVVRYKRLGICNIFFITIFTIVLAQLLLASLYVITRLPINEYTMSISIVIYLMSIMSLTQKYETDLENK